MNNDDMMINTTGSKLRPPLQNRLWCAGHGFKLAAVVGKILGDLSTTGRSSYDLSHFAISRFSAEKLASKL